jgi:hypothetical protein
VDVIDFGVLLDFALAGQVLDDNRIRRPRHILHLFGRQIVDGMGRHQQRQIVDMQVPGSQSGVRQECRGNDSNRRDTAFLEVD